MVSFRPDVKSVGLCKGWLEGQSFPVFKGQGTNRVRFPPYTLPLKVLGFVFEKTFQCMLLTIKLYDKEENFTLGFIFY